MGSYTIKLIPDIKDKLSEFYNIDDPHYKKRLESLEKLELLVNKEFGSIKEIIEEINKTSYFVRSPLFECLKSIFKAGYSEGFGLPPTVQNPEVLEGQWFIGEIKSLVLYLDAWRIGNIEEK